MTDREDRERESRESDEMLLLRRQREEQEHRHEVAERLREERTDEPEAEDRPQTRGRSAGSDRAG